MLADMVPNCNTHGIRWCCKNLISVSKALDANGGSAEAGAPITDRWPGASFRGHLPRMRSLLAVSLLLCASCGGLSSGSSSSASSNLDWNQQCGQRHAGVTAVKAWVQVTRYVGLHTTRDGTHEQLYGLIGNLEWAYDGSLVDDSPVQVDLRLADASNASGLDGEQPLHEGDWFELQGEYIPSWSANAGGNAVIHFTHAPCGWATIDGITYE